jgi:hypothetical protein
MDDMSKPTLPTFDPNFLKPRRTETNNGHGDLTRWRRVGVDHLQRQNKRGTRTFYIWFAFLHGDTLAAIDKTFASALFLLPEFFYSYIRAV